MKLKAMLMVAAIGILIAATANAQNSNVSPGGAVVQGEQNYCLNASNQSVPCGASAPLAVAPQALPAGATAISGNATGTTGAVTGVLAAAVGKTTYICGFNVSAIGGTAPVGPITVTNLVGGTGQTYQGSSSVAGGIVASATYTPCMPGNGLNAAITIATTADGTATAVDVNSWGYQQ